MKVNDPTVSLPVGYAKWGSYSPLFSPRSLFVFLCCMFYSSLSRLLFPEVFFHNSPRERYYEYSGSWGVNRHTARCTNAVSVVSQCKLVFG